MLGIKEGVRDVMRTNLTGNFLNIQKLTMVLTPTPGTETFKYSREPRIIVTRWNLIIFESEDNTKNVGLLLLGPMEKIEWEDRCRPI